MVTSTNQKSAGTSAFDLLPKILGTVHWERYDFNCTSQCIGNTRHGVRCRNSMGKEKRLRGQTEYFHLRTLCPIRDSCKSLQAINAFIESTYCRCHRGPPKDIAEQWFQKATPLPSKTKPCSSSPNPPFSTSNSSTSSPKSEPSPTLPPKVHSTRSNPETRATLCKINPVDLRDSIWEPFEKVRWNLEAIYNAIHETLVKPLSKDTSEGYLYCYTTKNFPEYVKIGMTSRADPNVRIREWTSQCRRQAELKFATTTPVHAMRRLEALVFAELAPYRVRERQCPGCGRRHQEWFRVSPKHAKMVAFKWSAFMETRPYIFGDCGWSLDPALEGDEKLLKQLCTPIEPAAATDMHAEKIVGNEVAAARRRHRRPRAKESATDIDTDTKPVKVKKEQSLVRMEDMKRSTRLGPDAAVPIDPTTSELTSLLVRLTEKLIRMNEKQARMNNQATTTCVTLINSLQSALPAI